MGLGPSKVFCIYTTSEGVFKQLFPNSDEMCDDFDVANHYLHKIMSQVSNNKIIFIEYTYDDETKLVTYKIIARNYKSKQTDSIRKEEEVLNKYCNSKYIKSCFA